MPRFSSVFFSAALALSATSLGAASAGAAPTPASLALAKRYVSGARPGAARAFRALGVLRAASYERTRLLPAAAPRASAAAKTTVQARAAATTLSFEFTGFSDDNQKKTLSNFVRANYDRMVAIFGAPSSEQGGKTVTVVGNGGIAAAYQPLLKPSKTDGGTIYFQYSGTDSAQFNTYNFTRLALLAFQGPNVFSYDYTQARFVESWLYGFADAAALLVTYGAAGSPANFDPSSIGPYVLPAYDLFNRPELGGAFVYSPDGTDLVVSDFRVAMAQSAWLKVAVERPTFFADFNAAYYAKFPARTGVQPNDLRALAAQIAPTVEGLSFGDWVRRQYVLDTSVTTGQKLYAAVLPLPILASGDRRAGFNGYAQAFSTDASGNDAPSTGYGSVLALDENGTVINSASSELSASNTLDFNTSDLPGQALFGAGFEDIGTPDRARITLRLRFKNAETTAYFPYLGATGSGASALNFYGVTANGDAGTLNLAAPGASETLPVARGAFVSGATTASGPRVVTTLQVGGNTFVRNTAWVTAGDAARGLGFVLDGAASSDSFAFRTASGASGVRLVSLPIFPLESDEAKLFGTQKLARYRPNLAPGTLQNGVLTFGISGDRHELYPNISTPVAPGRGYWMAVSGDVSRVVKGSEPSRSRLYEVPLLGGWNPIGVPFNLAFAPSALLVRYGGFAPVSYAQAVSNGWVRPGIWGWQGSGAYARVDGETPTNLQPSQGYYLYAVPARGVSLIFNPNAATAIAATTAQANSWSVPLVAATSATRDAGNAFGVGTRVAAAKPPAGERAVTLRFLSSGSSEADAGGAGAASGWADSFLAEMERSGSWDFVVEGAAKGERVALSWGDLAKVPEGVRLSLTDGKSGKSQRLNRGASYAWTADGAARRFHLDATRVATASLRVAQAPSSSALVSLTLSLASRGKLEIQNLDGDTLALLSSGDLAAGTARFAWNGRDSSGQLRPAARYRAVWTPQIAGDLGASREFYRR